MEVCVSSNTRACQDISNSTGSSKDPSNSTGYSSGDISMNDLKTCLTEFLINEEKISTSGINLSPGKNNKGNVVCVAFPAFCDPKSPTDGMLSEEKRHENDITSEASEAHGYTKSVDGCHSQYISLPIPLKPVSAMRGSREKLGIAPKKLSVTWAPDVYDPIPTSVSHVPSSKNQRYRNNGKKYGKKKQKGSGKASHGNKGKEKKQTQKHSGSTAKIKPLHDEGDLVVGISKPPLEIDDFNIVDSDPFCGSSFLKKSVTNLHFPVTEAT